MKARRAKEYGEAWMKRQGKKGAGAAKKEEARGKLEGGSSRRDDGERRREEGEGTRGARSSGGVEKDECRPLFLLSHEPTSLKRKAAVIN